MNKRIYITSLLIIADFTLFAAYHAQPRSTARAVNQQTAQQGAMNNFNFINQVPVVQEPKKVRAAINHHNNNHAEDINPFTLNLMQQMYASQLTTYEKASYINSILDYDDPVITIHQKIDQAENLLKIVNNDLSLHAGWLYNEDQDQVNWLKTQKSKINHRLAEFKWQAKHWSEQTLWRTAYIGSVMLGIIFAAYLGQQKYKEIDPKYKLKSFGELAWIPLEQLINLAQAAVIPAQYAAGAVVQGGAMAAVGAQALAGYIREAGEVIAIKGADRAQKDLHALAKNVAKSTEPTPPSWATLIQNYLNPENKNKTPQQAQPQAQNNNAQKQAQPQAQQPAQQAQQPAQQNKNAGNKQQVQDDRYKGPKDITLWDWINHPFEKWAYEKEVNRAAQWQVEMNKYQNNVELEMLKREKAEEQLAAQVQLEYQRLKNLGKPNPEREVQQMITKEQAQLEARWAKKDLEFKLKGQQLMNEAPDSIKDAMQAAQKQQNQNK